MGRGPDATSRPPVLAGGPPVTQRPAELAYHACYGSQRSSIPDLAGIVGSRGPVDRTGWSSRVRQGEDRVEDSAITAGTAAAVIGTSVIARKKNKS